MQKSKIKNQNDKVKSKNYPVAAGRRNFAFCILHFDFQKGFTLIELVIVVGIMALVGTLAFVSFATSRRVRYVAVSGQNALSVLHTAQARAVAGEDGAPWGVRLEPARFIIFSGASFFGALTTTVYTLPATVEIANIVLAGGGQEVVFHRLDGRTNQLGTFDVRAIGSASQIFSVTIDSSGRAYQTGTAPATSGTRVIDARHRNFALDWTIKNATTMELIWSDPPNPDVIVPVAMAPAAPRTSFDWSVTTAVGGQNQVLRIHALAITDTNTTLSVDRDCGYNNKRMTITIDTKTIATYETDCATITVGTFGGAMTEP
ncbi:MAG: type II secretion system protein [Candidatus Sungiibacteriota bacterium]